MKNYCYLTAIFCDSNFKCNGAIISSRKILTSKQCITHNVNINESLQYNENICEIKIDDKKVYAATGIKLEIY